MNMDKRAYWLWLQHAFGAGSAKPFCIFRRLRSVQKFYEGGIELWSSLRFISEKEVAALRAFSPEQAGAQLEYAEKIGQTVICPEDEEYPQALLHIDEPPAVLYVKGELPDFTENLGIGVVGSRAATESALKTTRILCYEMSKGGAVIVSGGALGIDAAAHRGAMMGPSPTVCVLACGIDYPYLMENQILRNRIVEKGGALVTEYPVNTGVNKGIFAVRNRIISGISQGLLVVEARKKSGSMITVKHATRQNRDIFAVPGDVNNPQAEGTNALIADGATPVLSAGDILCGYKHLLSPKSVQVAVPTSATERSAITGVSQMAKTVYECLSEEPLHSAEISRMSGLRASQILTAATELELMGHIKSYSGQRFSLK